MLYVDINFAALRFLFLRETPQAIVADDQSGHVYFMRPEKAANWITDIDLHPLPPSEKSIQILYAMDPGSDPKVAVAIRRRRKGRAWQRSPLRHQPRGEMPASRPGTQHLAAHAET